MIRSLSLSLSLSVCVCVSECTHPFPLRSRYLLTRSVLVLSLSLSHSRAQIINALIEEPVPSILGFVFTSIAFPLHYFFIRPRLKKRRAEIALVEIAKEDAASAKKGPRTPKDTEADEADGTPPPNTDDDDESKRDELAREPAAEVMTDVEY